MLIVHSLDKTTQFLSAIPRFIKQGGFNKFEYHVVEHPVSDAEAIIQKIREYPEESLIVFLGHGASHCIYLPITPDVNKLQLINKDNFHVLHGRHFISLSCRSEEFIRRNYVVTSNSTMLGFDDLPTHWDDVTAIREMDPSVYRNMTDDVLMHFRNLLVDVFQKALLDTLLQGENFKFFTYRLQLYINRHRSNVLLSKVSDNPSLLASILFDLKEGMKLFGNGDKLLK